MESWLEMSLLNQHWPVIALAARDEIFHALTTIVLVVALWPVRRLSMLALVCAVAGSGLIDLDHLPAVLGYDGLATSIGRPVTHSLATVATMSAIALACSGRWRIGLLSVTFGVAAHLIRDMGTGGVPLLWPISTQTVEVEYGTYFLSLTGFVMMSVFVVMIGVRELPWTSGEPHVDRI